MKHRNLLLALPLAAAISSTAAMAQPQTSQIRDNNFNWNYAQFGLEFQDIDGFDRTALYGRISHAIDEHLFLRGGLSLYDGDGDYDGFGLSAGLGFHTPLQQGLDLVLTGDLLHDRFEVGNNKDSETGARLAGGVRHATTSQLELSGGLFVINMYDDTDLGLYGEAKVKVTDKFDIGADLHLSGDYDAIGLFGRINF
jgi:opacity protein-like surface antigen